MWSSFPLLVSVPSKSGDGHFGHKHDAYIHTYKHTTQSLLMVTTYKLCDAYSNRIDLKLLYKRFHVEKGGLIQFKYPT